ncbi:MAG: hypothetical protein ACPGVD_12030 [Flavobacteriales bacterium]
MKLIKLKSALLLALIIITSCKKEDDPIPAGDGTAPEIISTDITSTRTLTNRVADSTIADYCITDFISIRNGAGLIIEPGVTIEFTSDAGISVGTYTEAGYLDADGSFAQKITFTGKTKSPGFWRGISVAPTNRDVRNLIDNSIIEYAGSSVLNTTSAGFGYKSAIGVGASSGNVGLISIKNSIIKNNAGKGYSCKMNSGLNQFFNNKFINNAEEAIFMGVNGFSKIDLVTTFSGNGFDGIYQDDYHSSIEPILDASTHTWANKNGSYFLSRGIRLWNDSATLHLDFGVEIIMGVNKMIHCRKGTFTAIGQLGVNRITIKGETSGVSSWKGIFIESNANNLIRNCDITEGGSQVFLTNGCNGRANIGVFYWAGSAGKVTVRDCAFRYSGGCGIYNETFSTTQHGDLTQSGNSFYGNAGSNICN